MSEQPIKVGLIGAGGNTRSRHIPGLQAIPGVEIVSVCNRSRESSQRVADAFSIPQIYEDWRALLADEDINAVVIGTWPYMHCDMTCAALEAGKHVQCEARMAMNATEAHTMLKASQAHPNLVAQIVPSPLPFKVDTTIRELIADGYIGDLIGLKVRGTVPGFSNPDGPLHWRHQKSLSGMNIQNMGIWYEASMRWVGPASRVYAITRVCVGQRRDASTGQMGTADVPDYVDIVADLENGAAATYEFSTVSGFAPGPGAWMFGTSGTLHYDHGSQTLYGGKAGDAELKAIEIPSDKAGAWRVEAEFVGAIRGQEKIHLTDFITGTKYMEFTEAVTRSAESGQAINLPLTGINV
jgi:predicted dehydrogenase